MKLFTIALGVCLIALVFAETNSPPAAVEPNPEYLPPAAVESAPLTENGYQYRTVRRLKYRHRREAPSSEYLPPIADKPSPDYLPPQGAATPLAADGYRYKTVRRLKVVRRHRREAPPSGEYLPPVAAAPTNEYLPPLSGGADTNLAKDGYRYKTVRRLRYRARHRRDVSELATPPSGEYLPPVDANTAADSETVVGKDGYRYKTVRRLRFRQRRRREAGEGAESEAATADAPIVDAVDGDGSDKIADIPVVEYLPPSNDVAEEPAPKSAELAKDGYRYKTVRRLKYRYRH